MYRESPMMCPRCARELGAQKVRSAVIRACTSCGGVWLDKAQTDIVMQRMPGGAALVTASNKAAQSSERLQVETDGAARCPVGGEEMLLCEAEDIRIDQCPEHGTWFDAHELRRIANAEAYREANERATAKANASSGSSSSWLPRSQADSAKPDLADWFGGFLDALYEADRKKY